MSALYPAIAALLLAVAGFIRAETEARRQRSRLDDVQRRVHADRRATDPPGVSDT